MSTSGFVYILSNETMPGIVKVGKTRRLPTDRSSELYTTGVATPFVVEFSMYSRDVDHFELAVHVELEDYRVNKGREFFKLSIDEAILKTISVFLYDFDHDVVHADFAIDPGNHAWYTHVCGVEPPDLVQVIDMLPEASWKHAAALLYEKRVNRKEHV